MPYRYFIKRDIYGASRDDEDGSSELLIGGRWVKGTRPKGKRHAPGEWECCSREDLSEFLSEHMIPAKDLNSEREGLRGKWARYPFVSWAFPPLFSSVVFWGDTGFTDRCHAGVVAKYESRICSVDDRNARDEFIEELMSQADSGYEAAKSRISVMETRAGYFLGAAGLTSTLLLANAGVFTNGEMEGILKWLVVVILGITSVFALATGLRALQVSMIVFERAYPDVPRVIELRMAEGPDCFKLGRLAALTLATRRAHMIADWKYERLTQARICFTFVVFGIVLTTACVLVSILF